MEGVAPPSALQHLEDETMPSPQSAFPFLSPTTPMTPGTYLHRPAPFQPYCLRIEYNFVIPVAGLFFHVPDATVAPYVRLRTLPLAILFIE